MNTTQSYYIVVTITRHFRQHSELLPLVDKDSASTRSINDYYYRGISSYQRDQGILIYVSFRNLNLNFYINGSNSSSSILIRLRLIVLSPIRVNKDELKIRLKLNELGKKDLIITNYIPIINFSKYYTKEKINSKKLNFKNIVNYISNY